VPSGAKARASGIAAIELLGRLRAGQTPGHTGRTAGAGGMVSWGAVREAFDRRDDRFTAERDRQRELLRGEEYQRLEASILNAQRT